MVNTKKFYDQDSVLLELVVRILCDTAAAKKADAAYLFAHTKDNDEAVLKPGANLWKAGKVKYLAICNGMYRGLVAGPATWKAKLIKFGVKSSAIVTIPLVVDFPPSTAAEAIGFVRFACVKKWKTAYVVSTPLHQLRAFVSMVSALKREQKKRRFALDFYSKITESLEWNEYNIHSQYQKGVKARRRDLVAKELAKINAYYSKGDLIDAAKMLKYLNLRGGN